MIRRWRCQDELFRTTPTLRRGAAATQKLSNRLSSISAGSCRSECSQSNGVGLDIKLRPFSSHRAGEHFDAAFCCRVYGQQSGGRPAGERAGYYNFAAAVAGDHPFCCRARLKCAGQLVSITFCQFSSSNSTIGLRYSNTGVIDQISTWILCIKISLCRLKSPVHGGRQSHAMRVVAFSGQRIH